MGSGELSDRQPRRCAGVGGSGCFWWMGRWKVTEWCYSVKVKVARDHHLPTLLLSYPLGGPLECPTSCRSLHFEILVLKRGCVLTPVLAAICFSPRFRSVRQASKPGNARERGEVVLKGDGGWLFSK